MRKNRKADKLFEELGYEPYYEKFYGGYYFRERDGRQISFWYDWAIGDEADNEVVVHTFRPAEEDSITVKEHLAIHQKMKELGWFDKKSKADKMFEKLGFEKEEDDYSITYKKPLEDENSFPLREDVVVFSLTRKTVSPKKVVVGGLFGVKNVNIDEMKAINEKARELGWFDE